MKQYEIEVTDIRRWRRRIWVTADSQKTACSYAYGDSNNIESLDFEKDFGPHEYVSVKMIREHELQDKKFNYEQAVAERPRNGTKGHAVKAVFGKYVI